MTTERSVEEIDWLTYLRNELYRYVDGHYHEDTDVSKHCEEIAKKFTQTLQAERQKREEVVEEYKEYVIKTIDLYNQKPSKGLDWLKWFLTRKAIDDGSITQPNNPKV